jgi:hypothetical protein
VEPDERNIIVGPDAALVLHVLVVGVDDKLRDAECVVVVAKGFPRGLELGKCQQLVGPDKQLKY